MKPRDSKKNHSTFTDRSGRIHTFARQGKEEDTGRAPHKGAPPHSSPHKVLTPDAEELRYGSRGKKKHGKPNKHEKAPNPKHAKPAKHGRRTEERSRKIVRCKATVDKNRKGFAFLLFEKREYRELGDAFVPPREAEKLFHGDRVEVTLYSHGGRKEKAEIHDIRVLSHRFSEVVGRFVPHPTSGRAGKPRSGWVVYEQKRAREEVYITDLGHHKIEAEEWVRAKLEFHDKGPFPVTGEVLEVYGLELPPSADVGMIAAEFSLIEDHSREAEDEARAHRLDLSDPDGCRDDLRSVPFITIDGETARDFDDAVYVERKKSGYILWVAIADVSHYVTDASALDQDARSRGTSVYFPERAFHMLPRALSENLCSLRPNEPRLAMVAKMEFDRSGKLHGTEIMEAIIESRRRATYNEIQTEMDRSRDDAAWEYAPHFELYELIRRKRQDRGSIDFDLPEAELVVKPTGEVVSIRERPRLEAHRLIEEFMIAANEAVTEWMMERQWPFVYRVHDEPSGESLERFEKLAATVGVRVSFEQGQSPQVMADLVRRLEGHPAQALLNMALLRSLKQAVYSSVHGMHYGLASTGYTHFTSPIRRYPDLVVHRLLRRALRTEKRRERALGKREREELELELEDICEHCSYRERLASDAERESIKLKQVRAMIPHLGQEVEARIVGMTENGLFAQVSDPYCEGFINRESMNDDFYVYNEERMTFSGRRKRRTFKIGDQVRVSVLRADVDRRQIDFGLVS